MSSLESREVTAIGARLAAARLGQTALLSTPPETLRPRDLLDAFAIQDTVADRLGWPVGGWKVGSSSPTGPINCARMYRRAMIDGGGGPVTVSSADYPLRLIEAEVAFRFARDLPPRGQPYDEVEVAAAIDACHPAIELLASRFADPDGLDPWTALADDNLHGGFVFGPSLADWRGVDLAREHLVVTIGGEIAFDRVGSNPAGPPLRLLAWLANEGATRAGGLKAGDIATTGSWIGKHQAPAGTAISVVFSSVGRVDLTFSS